MYYCVCNAYINLQQFEDCSTNNQGDQRNYFKFFNR